MKRKDILHLRGVLSSMRCLEVGDDCRCRLLKSMYFFEYMGEVREQKVRELSQQYNVKFDAAGGVSSEGNENFEEFVSAMRAYDDEEVSVVCVLNEEEANILWAENNLRMGERLLLDHLIIPKP